MCMPEKHSHKRTRCRLLKSEREDEQLKKTVETLYHELQRARKEIDILTCSPIDPTLVHLDVGGHLYTTSIQTLTRVPRSMLGIMFSGQFFTHKDPWTGRIFIDRDGKIFTYILMYLRTGEWCLPRDRQLIQRIYIEADYYGLPFFWDVPFQLNKKGIFSIMRKNLNYKNIQVVSTSRTFKQRHFRKLLGLHHRNRYSEQGQPARIRIDLSEYEIQPTHYCLRHNHLQYGALRGWIFKGKEVGSGKWFTLKRHERDYTIMNKPYSTASWPLDHRGRFYSSFVIKALPNFGSINISNIEMYGKLKPKRC